MSILFADLVGFTERSDRADPEDVRRILVPFHAAAKDEIERFGGTLDKFIGDAAMGVFGSPVAHEDDPERAVSAALAILRGVEQLRSIDPDLAIRVAVNTGDALVSLAGGVQVGESVAGDVVNTASRMQSVAAPGELVIGESTVDAVGGRFDVEPMPAATVKGKAEPLRLWRVAGASAGHPVAARVPFVDRIDERRLLGDAMSHVVGGDGSATIVIVADPGMGKSRLLDEMEVSVENGVRWRIGRCEPYGEGVTFGAVADVLRQEIGVERTADPSELTTALQDHVQALGIDPAWAASRLMPALGVGGTVSEHVGVVEIAVAFGAVLKARAAPLVLVFEDLHWAQPALSELVVALLGELHDSATLVLVTARPELLERDEGWSSRGELLRLQPLSQEDTGSLVSAMLPSGDEQERRSTLLERTGGNPLFAVELARMMSESGSEPAHVEVPSSIRAVIAARLDRLPAELRTLLQSAAVVGLEFWPGAVAASQGVPEDDVQRRLEQLVARGLADPVGASLFPRQEAFAFSHALVRDVAYGQLTRTVRARAHLEVTRWIERAAGSRADELAESLAYHAGESLEFARAAGLEETADEVRGPALRWILAAADRTARLDAAPAFERYERARALAEPGSAELAEALAGSAFTGRRSGLLEAPEVLRRHEEAVVLRRTIGDPRALGRSLVALGSQLAAMGDAALSREARAEAVRVLEALPPGPDLGRVYAYIAEEAMFAGRVQPALEGANRALELVADRVPDVETMALHIRGDARCSLGDESGLEDLERALELSIRIGSFADEVTSETYLAEWLWAYRGPAEGTRHYQRAIDVGERHGVVSQHLWSVAGSTGPLFDSGEWDLALSRSEELLARDPASIDPALRVAARVVVARISSLRGRPHEAGDPQELVDLAEPLEEMQVLAPALVVAAQLTLAEKDHERTTGYLERFAAVTKDVAETYRESLLAPVARIAVAVGRADLAADLVEMSGGRTPREDLNVRTAAAIVAEVRGDADSAARGSAEVADGWRAFGNPFELAMAILGRARCADVGQEAESVAEAHEILRSLGVPA